MKENKNDSNRPLKLLGTLKPSKAPSATTTPDDLKLKPLARAAALVP